MADRTDKDIIQNTLEKLKGKPLSHNGLPSDVFLEVVEQLSVAISITDINANILYSNPACGKLTGYPVQEMVGKNESILSDKGTPKEVYADLWKTIQSGQPWTGMLVNRRKDGSRYLADLTVAPVKDSEGKTVFFLGMHRDVTDLHNLQKKVLNQKSLIESVINSSSAVMVLVDADGKVVLDNLAYKSLMADLSGKEPAANILEAWLAASGGDLRQACQEKREFRNLEISMEIGPGQGRRWFSCAGSWARELALGPQSYFDKTEGQAGLFIVCNDITDRRRQYEASRINAIRALLAEQHMNQAMQETLWGAIYQLQGPVNVIGAAMDLIERQSDPDSHLLEALRKVKQSGQEALDRLRDAIPTPSREAIQTVNVNEAIRNVLDVMTSRFLVNGMVVDWEPSNALLTIPGRANAVQSLIKHLLDNAVDAAGEAGAKGREIIIRSGLDEQGRVELAIEDHGPGLRGISRLQVFEPFFSGWRNRRGGTGMGLTMAQQIVSEQGGSLEVDPDFIGGFRIYVRFSPQALADQDGGQ